MSHDKDPHHLTEADRDSETRFGTRRVPDGHRTGSPYPHRHIKSSRIIPSAPVSPDGRSAYPRPALSSKIIVWGGVALGVAGLTTATLLAARKISDVISDDPQPMPRAARQPPAEAAVAPPPKSPKSLQAPRGNIAQDMTRTANDLSSSLNGVAQTLLGAFSGFQRVASQANEIMSEFSHAADQLRAMTGRAAEPSASPPGDAPAPQRPDDARRHRL